MRRPNPYLSPSDICAIMDKAKSLPGEVSFVLGDFQFRFKPARAKKLAKVKPKTQPQPHKAPTEPTPQPALSKADAIRILDEERERIMDEMRLEEPLMYEEMISQGLIEPESYEPEEPVEETEDAG